jgi:decaprenylphospho-beta-D-ribofuranose 2-oxidase
MQLGGWGRYPLGEARVTPIRTDDELAHALRQANGPCIARGMGRSYGDSSLAAHILDLRRHDHFLAFDSDRGSLRCGAGATLAAILEVIVPRGWFLPVTPGTGFVSVGGAIASDVHGKNHHRDGAFSDFVECLRVMMPNGECVTCSAGENAELFRAVAGGMGLCGIIVDADLELRRIQSSFIDECIVKTPDLAATLAALDEHDEATYVVAWIDLNKRGAARGRALVMIGEHAEDGDFEMRRKPAAVVPFDLPAMCMNRAVMGLFNTLYYERMRSHTTQRRTYYEPYFYPLDRLRDWNRLYGRAGLLQHQSVVPRDGGRDAIEAIFACVTASGLGSPLAVLKTLGDGNENFLSFPRAGYTLAMDFKRDDAALNLLERLDAIVLAHGGRMYLAKDACMSESSFKRGYPAWERFQAVRERHGAVGRFSSLQAERLGL